jgi:hypothetical protein
MKWPNATSRWLDRVNRYEDWSPWFAWYPVTASGQTVWLETVEAKYDLHQDEDGYFGFWSYRTCVN